MTAASTKYDKKDLLRILQSDPWVKGSVSKSDFLDECHRLSHLEGLGFIECDFVIGGYRYKGLTSRSTRPLVANWPVFSTALHD